MNKIGVFYGSTTGTTEDLARRIAEKLEVPSTHIYDVSKLTEALVNEYDVLVLGSSTWGAGELQDDWYDGVKVLKKCDLSHKHVALFGCGDSDSYSDTFCDAIGILYEELIFISILNNSLHYGYRKNHSRRNPDFPQPHL